MTAFWHNKRVLVTGGAGFLGAYIVQKLRERGAAEIIVPRSSQYDLRDISAIRQLFRDVVPQSATLAPHASAGVGNRQSAIIVIHLAARVGGSGANREHASRAEFFYD
jgi:GDP-L-fucose synthase